jgi:type I restriction-modification system DNA methylase subunit
LSASVVYPVFQFKIFLAIYVLQKYIQRHNHFANTTNERALNIYTPHEVVLLIMLLNAVSETR